MANASGTEDTGVRRVRLGGVRRFIADRMMESLGTAAQLSFHGEADASRLLALRASWKTEGKATGIEDCLIACFARALASQPDLNGTAGVDEILLSPTVDIAVAIAAPDGLKTPVIRNVEQKSAEAIGAERKDLVARAFAGKLQVSEMKGGSATISNLGNSRVQHFTPILNSGQMVLLGIGAITSRLALGEGGAIRERKMMGLSLTVDHRVVDGEPAARLLTRICEEIETFDPAA